jgi:hypothetical protein
VEADGATMTEPHPQRCETCLFWDTPTCPLQRDSHTRTARYNLKHVSEGVGCASHSSAKSESAVLDELDKWIRDAYDYPDVDDWLLTEIMNKIAELRHAKTVGMVEQEKVGSSKQTKER